MMSKVSVYCRILAIIVLPIKTDRMLLASVMLANPAPTIASQTSVLGLLKIFLLNLLLNHSAFAEL